jgi:peptidoglycan/xylan/chitin deacetylase (PgdA/CDA1 family)
MPRELILTFHGLGDAPRAAMGSERNVWIPLEWFEAIVDALPSKGVGLAFDDGNSSDVELALPTLVRRRRTARFFPLAGRIDTPGYLTAEDIATLEGAGMRIGSHGLHHRDWRALEPRELDEELTLSRRTLAGIVGHDITETACPFGSYDRRVLRALRAAGYRRVFSSDGGTGSAGSWLSPRTTVHRGRPLQSWLKLVTAGPSRRPGPILAAKRLVKRLR